MKNLPFAINSSIFGKVVFGKTENVVQHLISNIKIDLVVAVTHGENYSCSQLWGSTTNKSSIN